jgi:hypothetical protein
MPALPRWLAAYARRFMEVPRDSAGDCVGAFTNCKGNDVDAKRSRRSKPGKCHATGGRNACFWLGAISGSHQGQQPKRLHSKAFADEPGFLHSRRVLGDKRTTEEDSVFPSQNAARRRCPPAYAPRAATAGLYRAHVQPILVGPAIAMGLLGRLAG